MGGSEVSKSVVKWSEVYWNIVKVLVTECLTLLEDTQITWSLLLLWLFRLSYSFMFFWFFYIIVYTVVCFVYFRLIL